MRMHCLIRRPTTLVYYARPNPRAPQPLAFDAYTQEAPATSTFSGPRASKKRTERPILLCTGPETRVQASACSALPRFRFHS